MSIGFMNCQHFGATSTTSNTTNQINHYCPTCGVTWTTWQDAKQVTAIKPWQDRMKPEYQDSALLAQPHMQAEIDELRAVLAAQPALEPMTDDEIIALRKDCYGGRFGHPGKEQWGDSLKFARAIEAHHSRKLGGT